jgi:hypothetical protein
VNQANGTPASIARLIIACACRGLVVNFTSPGMPAARPRSSVQDCGRYSSRSRSTCPRAEAQVRTCRPGSSPSAPPSLSTVAAPPPTGSPS